MAKACSSSSRRRSPMLRSSTFGCRRAIATRASSPPSGSASCTRRWACSSSLSTSRRPTRFGCSTVPGGGCGYLLKDRVLDAGQLVGALERVAAGETVVDPELVAQLLERRRERDPLADLTPREREILGLMAEGLTDRGIARAALADPQDGRDSRAAHPAQARPPAGRRLQPPRAGRPHPTAGVRATGSRARSAPRAARSRRCASPASPVAWPRRPTRGSASSHPAGRRRSGRRRSGSPRALRRGRRAPRAPRRCRARSRNRPACARSITAWPGGAIKPFALQPLDPRLVRPRPGAPPLPRREVEESDPLVERVRGAVDPAVAERLLDSLVVGRGGGVRALPRHREPDPGMLLVVRGEPRAPGGSVGDLDDLAAVGMRARHRGIMAG